MPDIPTLAESGLSNFDVVVWTALFAPAGTPRPVIDRLYSELSVILRSDSVKERLSSLSYDPGGMAPAEFGATVRADIEKWTRVARDANIRAQ